MKYFFTLQYVKLFYAFFVYFLCINSVFSFDFSKNEKSFFARMTPLNLQIHNWFTK